MSSLFVYCLGIKDNITIIEPFDKYLTFAEYVIKIRDPNVVRLTNVSQLNKQYNTIYISIVNEDEYYSHKILFNNCDYCDYPATASSYEDYGPCKCKQKVKEFTIKEFLLFNFNQKKEFSWEIETIQPHNINKIYKYTLKE